MTLAQRFLAMPRVARWAIFAGVALALYFVAVEPALDAAARLNQRADIKAAQLDRWSRERDTLTRAAGEIEVGVTRFGLVELPGDPESRPSAFNRAVSEIFDKHDISGLTSTSRTTSLGAGPLTTALGQEFRVDRLAQDVQFESTPEQAAAVIADLERSPLVAAITRLTIRKVDARDKTTGPVRVNLSVETWVQARKARAR